MATGKEETGKEKLTDTIETAATGPEDLVVPAKMEEVAQVEASPPVDDPPKVDSSPKRQQKSRSLGQVKQQQQSSRSITPTGDIISLNESMVTAMENSEPGVTSNRKYMQKVVGGEVQDIMPPESDRKSFTWEQMRKTPRWICRSRHLWHWYNLSPGYKEKLMKLTATQCLHLDLAETGGGIPGLGATVQTVQV